jgi:hypothetical protein
MDPIDLMLFLGVCDNCTAKKRLWRKRKGTITVGFKMIGAELKPRKRQVNLKQV